MRGLSRWVRLVCFVSLSILSFLLHITGKKKKKRTDKWKSNLKQEDCRSQIAAVHAAEKFNCWSQNVLVMIDLWAK